MGSGPLPGSDIWSVALYGALLCGLLAAGGVWIIGVGSALACRRRARAMRRVLRGKEGGFPEK